MLKLQDIEFPSKYLTCYESALLASLKYLGAVDEARLMGTQAYFVFSPSDFSISPKFNSIDEEWKRVYGCQVKTMVAVDKEDLRDKLISQLHAGIPVCLPVDLYSLPHTLHYKQLHQHHYVNVFGYDNGRYYMICPYYRFKGWVDADLIHDGFFSPIVSTKGAYLFYITEQPASPLSTQNIGTLVEENCRYMLNLAVPQTMADTEPAYLGLAGLATFTHKFQELTSGQNEETDELFYKSIYINLSRQTTAIGYARYWFHQLIQTCHPPLLTEASAEDLQGQFAHVTQSWKAIGMRLGMGVHGQRIEMIQQITSRLKQVHEQETRLFNTLLGALPDYEYGTL